MATVPSTAPSARARAVEAVLKPLLELFEAATGRRVAFFVELRADGVATRYACAPDGGIVETVLGAPSTPGAVGPSAEGLRLSSALHDPRGASCGHLEAASLSGRAFEPAAQAALEACARVLDAHFAGTGAPASPDARTATALLDPLTGLPNRAALTSELERMLARAQRDDMTVFAVCVGLSGLDDIAGSSAFDRQVGTLAGCLADSVRGGDLVARTGLHEFTVVGSIPRATAEASAAVVLERLHARCARSALQGLPRARIDIGFAVARIGEFDPQALLAEAEDGLFA